MKLDLGSDGRTPGWVSVDLHRGCDVRADVRALPFRDGCAGRVNASHVLEHVPADDVPTVLAEIGRVLTPCGVVLIRCPDVPNTPPQWADLARDGDPTRDGYEHLWAADQVRVAEMVTRAGFAVTEAHTDAWPPSRWPFGPEVSLACIPRHAA